MIIHSPIYNFIFFYYMNVYFSSSSQFYKNHKATHDHIIELLEKYGGKKPYIALGEIDYEKSTENEIVRAVGKMENELKNADIVVVENSYSVAGIGFEVATAVKDRKPTLVLMLEDKVRGKGFGPHPMITLKHKRLSIKEYVEKDLEKIIKKFISDAKEKIDTKFILIISPEIDKYLEWAADYKRMHKAQIVRNAVEKEMERDPDYKEHLGQKGK